MYTKHTCTIYVLLLYNVKPYGAYTLHRKSHFTTCYHELSPLLSSPCWSHCSIYLLFTMLMPIVSLVALFLCNYQSSCQQSNNRSSTASITRELTISDRGLKILKLCSIDSKQQLVERLHSYYQTNDPDLQQTTTTASFYRVAPMPTSDYLTYQEDELMNTRGENWDCKQTHLQTQTLQLDQHRRGDNFPVSTTQTRSVLNYR